MKNILLKVHLGSNLNDETLFTRWEMQVCHSNQAHVCLFQYSINTGIRSQAVLSRLCFIIKKNTFCSNTYLTCSNRVHESDPLEFPSLSLLFKVPLSWKAGTRWSLNKVWQFLLSVVLLSLVKTSRTLISKQIGLVDKFYISIGDGVMLFARTER